MSNGLIFIIFTSYRNSYSFGYYLKTNIFSIREPSPDPWNTPSIRPGQSETEDLRGSVLEAERQKRIIHSEGACPHLGFSPEKNAYPRPVAMAVVQVLMAIALCFYTMGLPGAIYVVSLLMGLGYGAHWEIVPTAASELFGLKIAEPEIYCCTQ
ncbi:hypothetical protein POM88_023840 [Heracleum sosnowskyi]|uniref:Uncharacterized protein n=1 Tax=Heracleum sosnowskyi TaxID=360622 RepID=A0AAD8II14_9APIA|nr:hypothetical protein POM88_023840 [Heracleum sosnowskyi]